MKTVYQLTKERDAAGKLAEAKYEELPAYDKDDYTWEARYDLAFEAWSAAQQAWKVAEDALSNARHAIRHGYERKA